jgi:hypothetical protein
MGTYHPMRCAEGIRCRRKHLLQGAIACLGIICLRPCVASPGPPQDDTVTIHNSAKPIPHESLRHLPVTFEPNVGQAEEPVQYVSRTPGGTVSFRRDEVLIELPPRPANVQPRTDLVSHVRTLSVGFEKLAFRFSGANSRSEIEALDPLPTKTNYCTGRDPSQWHIDIANYGRVLYHDLYPGINLLFHGEQGAMEYDFIVAPGANLTKIKMNVRGSRGMRLFAGSLAFKTPGGELRFVKPVAYQELNGIRTSIPGQFVILTTDAIGFRVGPYDHSIPLIIDPVLTYATLLGEGSPAVAGVAIDSTGEILIAGGGSQSVTLAKISSTGTSLVYSTIIGATNSFVTRLVVDSHGNAYVL